MDTIRRVHAGESVIQPRLAMRLIAEFSRRSGAAPADELPTEPAPTLTTESAGAAVPAD